MKELLQQIVVWGHDRDIPNASTNAQLAKLMEESGELARWLLRAQALRSQGKPVPPEMRANLIDAIGDTGITLINLAEACAVQFEDWDMDFEQALGAAFKQIKDRTGRMANGVYTKDSDL